MLIRFGTSNSSQPQLYGTWKSIKKQWHVFHSLKQGRAFWVDLLTKPLGYKIVSLQRLLLFHQPTYCKEFELCILWTTTLLLTGLENGTKETGVHWSHSYGGTDSTVGKIWPNDFCYHPRPQNEGNITNKAIHVWREGTCNALGKLFIRLPWSTEIFTSRSMIHQEQPETSVRLRRWRAWEWSRERFT